MEDEQALPFPNYCFCAADLTIIQPGMGLHVELVIPGFIQVDDLSVWHLSSYLLESSEEMTPGGDYFRPLRQDLPVVDLPEFEAVLQQLTAYGGAADVHFQLFQNSSLHRVNGNVFTMR